MSQTPDDLGQKIKAARDRQAPEGLPGQGADGSDGSAASSAMRVATDLVAAIGVGGFLGYWLDNWLGTRPWLMVVFLFLGFAAGFLNIYRAQMGKDYEIGFKSTRTSHEASNENPADDAAKKE